MIHDKARVEGLRARVAAQVELIKSLEVKIVKGKLDALKVARNQTEDIETLYLQDLEREHRTPAEEARWLSCAEHNLEAWVPFLKQTRRSSTNTVIASRLLLE